MLNLELSSRRKAAKPGQIVEVVHDDGDEEVDHDEGAEEDEGDEVDVGHVGAAGLLRVDQLSGCRIPEEVDNVRLGSKEFLFKQLLRQWAKQCFTLSQDLQRTSLIVI